MAGARRVRGRGKAPGARHDRCVLDRCGPRAWRSQPRDTAHGRRARLLRTEFADAVSFFTARASRLVARFRPPHALSPLRRRLRGGGRARRLHAARRAVAPRERDGPPAGSDVLAHGRGRQADRRVRFPRPRRARLFRLHALPGRVPRNDGAADAGARPAEPAGAQRSAHSVRVGRPGARHAGRDARLCRRIRRRARVRAHGQRAADRIAREALPRRVPDGKARPERQLRGHAQLGRLRVRRARPRAAARDRPGFPDAIAADLRRIIVNRS